jgi:metallo-beta-lactamase family protein
MKLIDLNRDGGIGANSFFIQLGELKILVDCGMFQERLFLDRNWEPFPLPPAEIDACLLTHAHLDHCGRLPLLVKRGFRGEVVTTSASRELIRLVLLDAAHLQEEEARYRVQLADPGLAREMRAAARELERQQEDIS